MAVGKVVGGVAAGLGLVGLGYAGLAGQDDTTRDESGAVVEGGDLGALRIRVGDCFLDAPDGVVEAVDAVPCSDPHVNEVYGAFNIPGGDDAAFPGLSSIQTTADEGCYDRSEGFVGLDYESSIYGHGALYPTDDSWTGLGDREVLCLISSYDGTTKTGSARNTRE